LALGVLVQGRRRLRASLRNGSVFEKLLGLEPVFEGPLSVQVHDLLAELDVLSVNEPGLSRIMR
jgi:hypothetical protein